MRPTVSDRLRGGGQRLVGRGEELARARELLRGGAVAAALHVHGPGGVGKTAFLREVERLARAADRPTRWVDPDDLGGEPGALPSALGADSTVGLAEVLPQRVVILVDRLDALGELERWFWGDLVPALPADALLVTAGRCPPTLPDPRLADLVAVLALRNLPPADAAALLHERGIPEEVEVDALVRATYGHPLALVIAADGWVAQGEDRSRADPGTLLHHPDPAARLLGRFLDEAVDPDRREALHVAAHVRRVDRAMLRGALRVDSVRADELLGWLRSRPYAEVHPDGLALHDVVRDALDADLRWRDPDAYEQLHSAVREVVLTRLRGGDEPARLRAATDLLFLHRGNPATHEMYDYPALGRFGARAAGAADRPTVEEVVARVEGPARADAVLRHLADRPDSVRVLEDAAGGLLGVGVVVRLDDPVARSRDALGVACWDLISERRPPEAGEHVLLELLVDADHPRRLRTVTDVGAALSLSAWSRPHLGWVVVASRHGELWGPVWSYIGFAELGVATPDGDEVSVWGRDFGRSPFEDWLVEMRRRELDASGTLPGPVPAPVAFTHEDFADHVLDLLRDLHRPERLAVNPLVRSELVRRDGAGSPTEQLREAVVEAVARVEEDPPTERAARAVDRTYLRRGLTQEAAAEVLGMPFSTYRRHLARGLEAVVARLWAWELHGGRRTGST